MLHVEPNKVNTYYARFVPGWDWFTFTIRQDHLLGRIEEKNLVFVVRYVVQGQEVWDKNGRQEP